MSHKFKALTAFIILGSLVACGGGGGGSEGGSAPAASGGGASSAATSSVASSATSSSVASSSLASSSATSSVSSSVASSSVASSSVASSSVAASSVGASSSSSVPAVIAWNRYNGSVDTNVSTAISLAAGGTSAFTSIVGSYPDGAGTANFVDYMNPNGDGTLRLDSSASAINRSLVRSAAGFTATYPRSLTYLMRLSPVAGVTYDANTRLAEMEIAFNDARVVFVLRGDVHSTNVRLQTFENGGPDVNAQLDMTVPHIFQISVTMTSALAGTVTIYADGNNTPIIGPVSTTNMNPIFMSDRNYVQFGDGRNAIFRSDLDWMAWTHDGAFTPANLVGKLPSGLGVTTGY